MLRHREAAGVLLLGCCALGACDDSNVAERFAAVTGAVGVQGGVPAADSSVAISCQGVRLDTTVAINASGRYAIGIDVVTSHQALRCSFGIPDLVQPIFQVDTSVALSNGGLFPQQIIDLTQPPAP